MYHGFWLVCKVGGYFFAFGGGTLPLVWVELLRVPPVLEGPDLLFSRMQPSGKAPGSPGSAAALPADHQRKEGTSPGRKPPSPRVTEHY